MLADQLALDLPMTPAAPSIARRAIDGLGLDGLARANALLLASELVSNALRHSGASPDAPIHLTASVGDVSLRMTVTDRGHGFVPDRERPEPGVAGGYGLFLVELLADAWGIDAGGTRVWLELPLRSADD